MASSFHSSDRSINEEHVLLQQTEVTEAGEVPMLRRSCLQVESERRVWRHSQRWPTRTSEPDCVGSQKNAGNYIFTTATCKLWVQIMRDSMFSLIKYILKEISEKKGKSQVIGWMDRVLQ